MRSTATGFALHDDKLLATAWSVRSAAGARLGIHDPKTNQQHKCFVCRSLASSRGRKVWCVACFFVQKQFLRGENYDQAHRCAGVYLRLHVDCMDDSGEHNFLPHGFALNRGIKVSRCRKLGYDAATVTTEGNLSA